MPLIRGGEHNHWDVLRPGIALQARQDLNARTPWQVQVEEDEVGVGSVSGPLLLPRSQQVIESGCPSPSRMRAWGGAPT